MSTDKEKQKKEFSFRTFSLNTIWIVFSFSGLAIIAYFLYQLNTEYTFSHKSENAIDLAKTAQVGDFIGGLVGSLWAFAGVILFYLALKLQNKEFVENRKVMVETRKVMDEQLTSLKFNSDLETLNYLIQSHNETIDSYNKKGLLSEEEDDDRTKLIQEKAKAKEILLNMAKDLMSKETANATQE